MGRKLIAALLILWKITYRKMGAAGKSYQREFDFPKNIAILQLPLPVLMPEQHRQRRIEKHPATGKNRKTGQLNARFSKKISFIMRIFLNLCYFKELLMSIIQSLFFRKAHL
jgi:hypothetical protein